MSEILYALNVPLFYVSIQVCNDAIMKEYKLHIFYTFVRPYIERILLILLLTICEISIF